MSAADAARLLDEAVEAGWAQHREGRISGYALTQAGRAHHAELLEQEITPAVRSGVDACYRRFRELNPELLSLCTDWQLHADPAVRGRLAAVDDAVQPVCVDLTAALGRFGRYGSRLAEARHRLDEGHWDWLARPLVDSYHSIWFELHEDLLCTLGIERSKEELG
jgi:hypothetical protein